MWAADLLTDFLLQGGLQERNLVANDIPECFGLQAKISVRQDIPEPCDSSPLNFQIMSTNILWKILGNLAYDLEIPDYGISSR